LVSEQPIIAPAIKSGSTAKQTLRTFMSLLWSGDGVSSICSGVYLGQAASANGANRATICNGTRNVSIRHSM
jgi:hypothetical protein